MNNITNEIPSLELLAKLLDDDSYFYQLANSKDEIIFGFKKSILIKHLKDYIRSLVNSSNILSEKFLQKAKYYNDKFELNILYFRNAQDGLNQDFYDLIMDKLNKKSDDLARKIYIRLGEELCYDPRMPAYNQNLNVEEIEKIHYAKTSSITKDNRIVTCKSWAETYKAFLNANNISARVVQERKHYYVLVNINGIEFKADATNSFLDNDNIYINDLTRIKLKTPTCGYLVPFNKQNDKFCSFKSLYELYEEYLKDYPISRFVTTGDAKIDMILAKIDYLNTVIYNVPQIEAVAFLKELCSRKSKIFDEEEIELLNPKVIKVRNNNQYSTTILLVINNNNSYIYRLLNPPEGLIDVTDEYLRQITNNNLVINGSNLKK